MTAPDSERDSARAAIRAVLAAVAVGTQGEAREEPGAILVRPWTGPQDMHGMVAAVAVVTEEGGSGCHAAALSRAFETSCVTGCGPGTLEALDGQEITVDGDTGRIWVGELPVCVTDEAADGDLRRLPVLLTAIAYAGR